MKKTEILRQSAAAMNDLKLDELGQRIEGLRQAKLASAEELAAILEPLAQAMAALTDETRCTLELIGRESKALGVESEKQSALALKGWRDAAASTQVALDSLNRAARRMVWRHYLLAMATGLATAVLVSGFWRWLAPPTVVNELDAQLVAEHLKPAIAALKPSKGR